MPYKIQWYVPDRVILGEYHGVVTVAELGKASRQVLEMFDGKTHQVYVISNLLAVQKIPTNLKQVQQSLVATRHPCYGGGVVITDHPLRIVLVRSLALVLKRPMHSVKSLEDAHRILIHKDASLRDLLPPLG